MGLNRDKFRSIVGGITTPKPEEAADEAVAPAPKVDLSAGQGRGDAGPNGEAVPVKSAEVRRFAKRGRPKGRKDADPSDKTHKIKVSLYIDETLTNDLYDWAHEDKMHPGEMFDRALRFFHKHETKRRKAEKEEC